MKLAAILSIMLASPAFSQVDRHAIDRAAEEVLGAGTYPALSVAVFQDGQLAYAGQYGHADLGKRIAPKQDTVFRMYSVSKGLTQILAAVLVDEGSLDLNAPISRYVQGLPEQLRDLTADQLLNHRGGIRHYSGAKEWMELSKQHCSSPVEAIPAFAGDSLLFAPGTKESYSSFGYVLLSAVLEQAGGAPFGILLEKKLFQPSGASKIHLDTGGAGNPVPSAQFYERRQGAAAEFDVAPAVDNSCKFGGGAVNGTPAEIARVFSAFYAGKLTSKPILERFVPAAATGTDDIVSFGGEGLGGRSVVVAVPARNVVVTIAANARGGSLEPLGKVIVALVSARRP